MRHRFLTYFDNYTSSYLHAWLLEVWYCKKIKLYARFILDLCYIPTRFIWVSFKKESVEIKLDLPWFCVLEKGVCVTGFWEVEKLNHCAPLVGSRHKNWVLQSVIYYKFMHGILYTKQQQLSKHSKDKNNNNNNKKDKTYFGMNSKAVKVAF